MNNFSWKVILVAFSVKYTSIQQAVLAKQYVLRTQELKLVTLLKIPLLLTIQIYTAFRVKTVNQFIQHMVTVKPNKFDTPFRAKTVN